MSERINQLLQFLEPTPDDAFLQYALALEYVKQGNNLQAEKYFQSLIVQHPDYVATYYQFGKMLEETGREEEAKKIYMLGMNVSKASNPKTYNELKSALEFLEL